jgi:magnesium-transporting ATPase (P-type)
VQESPYLAALGWSGLTFVDPGIEGTYVLGAPDVLQAHLKRSEQDATEAEQRGPGLLRRTLGRAGSLFRRSEEGAPGGEAPPEDGLQSDARGLAETAQGAVPETEAPPETGQKRPGLWSRTRARIRARAGRVLDRLRGPDPQVELDPQIRLLLAYSPQPRSLFNARARPELPSDLIPICALRFGEQIQQDAVESIHALQEAGVQVKLFVPGDPESALAAAARLDLDQREDRPLNVPSGAELSEMDEDRLARSVSEATVFSLDAPDQEAELVRALRRGGGHVAVLGDAVDDVPVLRQADLRMSFRSSSQVVLAASGLVLMRDALQALPRVVQRGRRNVNNVLNVLVLNLAQIVHLLVLELLVLTVRQGVLFYHPVHGGVIAAFSIVLPGLTLSFWSAERAVPPSSIVPRLARFVLPAGLTRVLAVIALDYLLARAGVDIVHRRNAVTLLLILTGLILYVHLQPALFIKGVGPFKWRYVGGAVVVLGLYFVVVSIPLAQKFLYLRFLPREDYVTVGLVAVLWALGVHALWRIQRLNPYLGGTSDEGGFG